MSYALNQGPAGDQAGTGRTSASITWGDVGGWTVTGSTFCHADPSYICSLANFVQDDTIDPLLQSSHYDIGTWLFHGTGFGATPFIYRTAVSYPGNQVYVVRGALHRDGSVPALPLLGLGAVASSIIILGASGLRRGGRAR